jgi:D-alanyl-lipoteichoic acid acyltransferase DltB (MBOAT superfamily)
VWSAALLAFAFVPTYATVWSGPHGSTIRSTRSLVSVNGHFVLVVLAVPLVISVLVGLALLFSRHRVGLAAAWSLTLLLAAFNLLALLSIGLLVVPATAALVAACALSGTERMRPEAGLPDS